MEFNLIIDLNQKEIQWNWFNEKNNLLEILEKSKKIKIDDLENNRKLENLDFQNSVYFINKNDRLP